MAVGQSSLRASRRPVQGIQRHAPVDPAGRVPRVERVGERREEILGDARCLLDHGQIFGGVAGRQVDGGETADHELRESAGVEAFQKSAGLSDQAQANLVGHDLCVQEPLLGGGHIERLRQEIVHLHHLDPALPHLRHEVEMIALGALHPHHVVEQELIAVARGEARMREARRADEDFPQGADFGVDAVRGGHAPECLTGPPGKIHEVPGG